MGSIVLYSYCKSSAAFRVRISLNLKSITHRIQAVNLLPDIAENWNESYMNINPQGLVPVLKVGEEIITQSAAIMEYLEEAYPETPLLPKSALQRAGVRSLVQIISCDIHPLNNLRVLDYLKMQLHCKEPQVHEWYCYWVTQGLIAFEKQLKAHQPKGHFFSGHFCSGDKPGLADACLIPQLYNARRLSCDISRLENCMRIEE
ncbi:Maleylacetoacetate isomerase @ Glutathione S-transferase, zeta, partial [hydrothermal vent metagenome]